MSTYILNSLKQASFVYKNCSYRLIATSLLLKSNITEIERKWNETKDVPEYFNYFQDVIKFWKIKENNSERQESPAFWHVDKNNKCTKWSYKELVSQVEKTANVLKSCGLTRNDRVVIILPKIPEWWLVTLATIQLGIVSSPGPKQLRSKDILYRINSIEAKCIVTDLESSEEVDQIAKDCPTLTTKILCSDKSKDSWIDFKTLHQNSSELQECVKTKMNDPMIIFFTSGSTGDPKIVQHTQEYAFALSVSRKYLFKTQSDSLIWNISDTGWIKSAWGSLFVPWSSRSGIFIHQFSRFDPKTCLKILQENPITHFCAPPTAYKLLVKEDLNNYQFPYLKYCISGGEILTKEVFNIWKQKTGLTIYELYGQTETALLSAAYHCNIIKPGSVGMPPVELLDLVIVNEDCKEVDSFEEGELAINLKPNYPLGLFKGYMNNLSKTEEVFKKDYYLTGDRGFRDNDGYFWIIGRSGEIIKSSGYRIGPTEVESALHVHPAIKECAVVASPDPLRGEVVKAFVILKEEYRSNNKEELKRQLQDHTKSITAPYKFPRKIEFVEDLPRTSSGKIQRTKLRIMEREAYKNI